MRGCTEVITLLNAQVDPDTGYDVYTPTKITGVSWYSTAAATVTTSGLLAADPKLCAKWTLGAATRVADVKGWDKRDSRKSNRNG